MTSTEDVRRTVAEATAAMRIALADADDGWDVRGVPLAPFPARLRLDDEQQVLWHDVVVAEVVPPVAVEAVVEDIDLPRPEVRLMVGEARWMVAISYPLPYVSVTTTEVSGLLGAGALYATALAVGLTGHLGKQWRGLLEAQGFVPGVGPDGDPRDLLRSGTVVAWPLIGQ